MRAFAGRIESFRFFGGGLRLGGLAAALTAVALLTGCRPATTAPASKAAPTAPDGSAAAPAESSASIPAADLARFNRGLALLEQYKYDKAIDELSPVVAAQPDWTAARFDLALALLNDQRAESVKRAEQELLKILEKQPDHPASLFCLARLYLTNANTDKAIELLGRLYKLDPADPFVAFHYGNALASVGKNDEAAAVLEGLVQRDDGFVSGVFTLGGLYRKTRQPAKAQAMLRRFKQLNDKELVAGSFQVADPYGGHGKYYTAIAADGLPLAAAKMSPAPKVVFSPDARKIDAALRPWKWPGGEVQTPGVAVGDLNGDDNLDLVIAGIGESGAAQVFWGDGKGGFTPGPRLADKVVSPCLGDVNNDGHLDIWLGRAGEDLLLLNGGKGNFTRAKDHPATLGPGPGTGLTACARLLDMDNDGDLDLLAVRIAGGNVPPGPQQAAAALAIYVNRSPLRFTEEVSDISTVAPGGAAKSAAKPPAAKPPAAKASATKDALAVKETPAAKDSPAPGAAPAPSGDSNADSEEGDVDKGGFEESAARFGLAMEKTPLAAVLYDDFDNDRDIDLLLLPANAPPIGWENHREGKFKLHEAAETGLNVASAAGATTGDPFKTGFRSVLVFGKELALFHNKGHWKFEKDAEFAAKFGALGGTSGQFVDIDNDGDLDLLIADARRGDGTRGPVLLLNDWPNRRFVNAAEADPGIALAGITVPANAVCVAGDFSGRGACDVLLLPEGGQPLLIPNLTKGGHYLAIDLLGQRGQKRMSRSPNVAIGARVEWRSGTVSQQQVVGAPAGATAMPPLRLHAGIGAETQVQWLRILWPDSALQAELEIGGDQLVSVFECNRRPSSCPHLFAWTGRHYEFVSDFGGVGGLGYRTGPNSYAAPDPTEYVVLPKLVPQDGDYVVQVLEPLQEVVYVDELKLLAVDHPAGTTVQPNEMAAVAAPPPPFELFCYDKPIEPVRAVNHRGEDVTDALRRTDRVYAEVQARRSYTGLARRHHIELDFGDRLDAAPAGSRRILMLDGWVEYSTSTSNYAAAQAGLRLEAPSVFVARDGRWVELLHEVGYPAGINHRMTLDLTGLLRPGDRTLRIATNMEIYWDRAFVAAVRPEARNTVREVAARSGHLHFRGYPREYSPDGRQPNLLDYSNIDSSTAWLRMSGAYTRYGDVTELLGAADDCFVIMSPGDEVTVRFPAAALPPVPPGFTRTFLLKTDSYCKDMDLYTGGGARVEPLPFHGMSNYPYGPAQRYPDTEKTRQYRTRYNTRVSP